MDVGAILETCIKVIFGYAIMFGIIVLLMLPFLYAIGLYERMKERSLVTDENLINPFEEKSDNPFRFLENINKRHQKSSIKHNLARLRNEIHEQRKHIHNQRKEITKLSEVNQQLMSIVIKMRNDLRGY